MDELMDLFTGPILAINVGIQDFGRALEEQGIQVVYVDWNPPAGGDQEMIDLLDQFLYAGNRKPTGNRVWSECSFSRHGFWASLYWR